METGGDCDLLRPSQGRLYDPRVGLRLDSRTVRVRRGNVSVGADAKEEGGGGIEIGWQGAETGFGGSRGSDVV